MLRPKRPHPKSRLICYKWLHQLKDRWYNFHVVLIQGTLLANLFWVLLPGCARNGPSDIMYHILSSEKSTNSVPIVSRIICFARHQIVVTWIWSNMYWCLCASLCASLSAETQQLLLRSGLYMTSGFGLAHSVELISPTQPTQAWAESLYQIVIDHCLCCAGVDFEYTLCKWGCQNLSKYSWRMVRRLASCYACST